MTKGQWFAIFIIAIFVFSMVAVLFSGDSLSGNPSPTPDTNSNTTPIPFQSDFVDANVVELFPYLIVTADTSSNNIDGIDSQVFQIKGIENVQSQFISSGNIQYYAYVQFSKDANPKDVFAGLQQISALSNVQAKQQGLVQLPSSFKISNSALNLFQTFYPPSALTQALLSIDAQKGDAILVRVDVELVNQQPSRVVAEQVQAPRSFIVFDVFSIVGVEPILLLQGSMDYFRFLDENKLRALLASTPDVNQETIYVSISAPIKPKISFDIHQPFSQAQQDALQQSIQSNPIPDINNFTFSQLDNGLTVNAYFNPLKTEKDLNNFEKNFLNVLSTAGYDKSLIVSFKPQSDFVASIEIDSNDARNAANFLKTKLKSKTASFLLFQRGSVHMDYLLDASNGEHIPLSQSVFPAALIPGHRVDENSTFQVQATVLGNTVQQMQIIEADKLPV